MNEDCGWLQAENDLWMNWTENQMQYLGLILLLDHFEGETIFSLLEEFTKASYLESLWNVKEGDAFFK